MHQPYPINGHPGDVLMGRIQGVCLQCILMHQLVSKISIHAAHDGAPGQLRTVKIHALQAKIWLNKTDYIELWNTEYLRKWQGLNKRQWCREAERQKTPAKPHTHTHRVPYALGCCDDIMGGFHTEDDWKSHVSQVQQTSLRGTEFSINQQTVRTVTSQRTCKVKIAWFQNLFSSSLNIETFSLFVH